MGVPATEGKQAKGNDFHAIEPTATSRFAKVWRPGTVPATAEMPAALKTLA
jgi:hypothetical protein